jgi:outer membrane receptor protein involved in Fe transport
MKVTAIIRGIASALAVMLAASSQAWAQSQPPAAGSITGTVVSGDGTPLGGAAVALEGAAAARTTTSNAGSFLFATVAPGVYSVVVSKPGYGSAQQDGVAVVAGQQSVVHATLTAASFSSLREIGRVATTVPGRASINTTTAAITTVTNQTFVDQGAEQVMKVLGETPGIVFSRQEDGTSGNGASQVTGAIPQIRGALPYETESLIDGHPVSVGANGVFQPLFLNPALLSNVEVSKGPGAMATDINYAIGGSVNYRTLEPTRTFHSQVTLGLDAFGGQQSSFRVTGSTKSHAIDYAFGYAIDGTPGPLNNYPIAGSQVPLVYGAAPYFINGQGVAQFPEGIGPGNTPQYAGLPGQARFAQPLYVCCSTASTQFLDRAELAKLRFNFSEQSSLTISYLGGQSSADYVGARLNSLDDPIQFSTFAPPPGYTGSVPAGQTIPFDLNAYLAQRDDAQQNLFQAEFRSALGPATLLARFYGGVSTDYQYNAKNPTNESFSGRTWGGVLLCAPGVAADPFAGTCANGAAPVQTYFNGQVAQFTSGLAQLGQFTQDHLHGYSVELDRPIGNNIYSVSFDRSQHDSYQFLSNPVGGVVGYQLSPGSSQAFTTVLLRAQLALGPRLSATISNYATQYSSHYSGDGGMTWSDSTHAYDAPRLGLTWRPNVDTSWRFALGSSIAPPYINLLSAPAQVPQPNSVPATYYTLNENSGNISPETAFGYDLGVDRRLGRSLIVSADGYLTSLRNLFLPSTFLDGTYTNATVAPGPLPLYVTQTQNLGLARYEGIEVSLRRVVPRGFGFVLQGALQRDFTYNLPASFYDTAAGPYTTNLGIIPNVNFQPTSIGYNGFLGARVPYSTGYFELNGTTRELYGNVGVTYFGPNNSYNRPAFAVISASLRARLGRGLTLQLSGDNLTGVYDKPFYDYFGGIPVPLVNGAHGATSGNLGITDGGNYGPATVRLVLRHDFGG